MENLPIENVEMDGYVSENIVKGCFDVIKEAVKQQIISDAEKEIQKDNNEKDIFKSVLEQSNITEKTIEFLYEKKLDKDSRCNKESEITKRFGIGILGFLVFTFILSRANNKNDS